MDGLWRLHDKDESLHCNPEKLFNGNSLKQHIYPYFTGMGQIHDLRSTL
jgi:hypothetical protein